MKEKRRPGARVALQIAILLALLIAAICLGILALGPAGGSAREPNSAAETPMQPWTPGPDATIPPTPEPTQTPEPTPTPIPDPKAAQGASAADFGLECEMILDGQPIELYAAAGDLTFPEAKEYSVLEGVTTFRGNNYRDDPTYGNAGSVKEKKLKLEWTTEIPGSIAKSNPDDGSWFGCGWTGQPLIVRWPEATRSVMNLYGDKKAKDDLVEVIYATENSYIYFLDLDDGLFTRDRIAGKWTFKGSGSLDPRGYPLLYVGAGDAGPSGATENMIFSLIDGKKLYRYGNDDPFSLRGFKAFDAATLVSAASDVVTYASESGIIYQFKLNTAYDETAGTISVAPSNILKWRYTTERSRKGGTGSYWLGFESSPVIWRHYMYASDNAGNLFCIDINTMGVVWMQDVLDDTNCSPVFEYDEATGEASIYIGTSLHWTVGSDNTGMIPFWRIDALTGAIVWKDPGFRCTRSSVSGGIQDTAALGKNNLSDLVFVNYAMTTETNTRGVLVAYSKADGKRVWTKDLDAYSWSSPLVIYDENGDGYVVTFDSAGKMYLFDGRKGDLLDKLELSGNFEASPAAFNDMIVIGTRASKIYGIRVY